MGPIKPTLALCVFAVFVLVYFSLWKGVKSTGKVSKILRIHPKFLTLSYYPILGSMDNRFSTIFCINYITSSRSNTTWSRRGYLILFNTAMAQTI